MSTHSPFMVLLVPALSWALRPVTHFALLMPPWGRSCVIDEEEGACAQAWTQAVWLQASPGCSSQMKTVSDEGDRRESPFSGGGEAATVQPAEGWGGWSRKGWGREEAAPSAAQEMSGPLSAGARPYAEAWEQWRLESGPSRAGEAEPQAGAPRGLLKVATDTTAQISLDEQDLKQRCIRQGPLAPLDFKYAEVSALWIDEQGKPPLGLFPAPPRGSQQPLKTLQKGLAFCRLQASLNTAVDGSQAQCLILTF